MSSLRVLLTKQGSAVARKVTPTNNVGTSPLKQANSFSQRSVSTRPWGSVPTVVASGKVSKAVLVGSGVMAAAVVYGVSQTPLAKTTSLEDQAEVVVDFVDKLYDSNKMREALEYLERFAESDDPEVLWRLARLCYKVGKYQSTGPTESRELSVRGMEFAERAVTMGNDSFACHKWKGILITYSSEFEGYKRKIERSYDIRDSFVRAIELNPMDPTCRHLLGQWCYGVSSVPWYQKKLATMMFATPPRSDFEEALKHFQEAENIEPGFYSTNWLFIGKSLLQLGRVHEAGEWLKKSANFQSDIGDDIEARDEAITLLSRLSIPVTDNNTD